MLFRAHIGSGAINVDLAASPMLLYNLGLGICRPLPQ